MRSFDSLGSVARHDIVRFVDSYASLLVLLLANFFLLELVDDPRWGALGSTLLAARRARRRDQRSRGRAHAQRRHWLLIGACVALAPIVLIVDSERSSG